MASSADRVCLGVIGAPHGVRGAFRVKTFTDVPEDLVVYGALSDEAGSRTFELRLVGEAKGQVVVKAAGVADRDAAQALRGTRLYVDRAALPPPDDDEFYYADLIGMTVVDRVGATVGTVKAVQDYGAGDLIEIALEDGGEALVPFTRATVPTVDVAGRRIVIDPPDGLFDD